MSFFFSKLSYGLDITINSGVKILDSYFDKRNGTSGFDSCFGLPRLLWSSTSFLGFNSNLVGISDLRFKVFDCFCLCIRALTRALGFPASFGGCHQYRMIRAAPAPLAGAGTGRGQATGSDGQPPICGIHCLILLYLCICSYRNVEFCGQTLLHQKI